MKVLGHVKNAGYVDVLRILQDKNTKSAKYVGCRGLQKALETK